MSIFPKFENWSMEMLVSSAPQALNYVWGKRFATFDGLECVKLADIGKIYYICIDIDQKYLPIIWVIFL